MQRSVVLAVLAAASAANGAMQLKGYAAKRHDRFYRGADKEFIGAAFDWSGVGKAGGRWVTMISPRYFLSASHLRPASGASATFYEGNTTARGKHTYKIDKWSYATTLGGKKSDLYLGRLTKPIPAAHKIAHYPILALESEKAYVGLEIYVYGSPNRVGRNKIDKITTRSHKRTTLFRYDPAAGADEAYLKGGDSGAPSFANVGGRLALVGIHYGGKVEYPTVVSIDSFVPFYIKQLNAHMQGEQLTLVGKAPEPGPR